MKTCCIYIIRNEINGKVYIGQTVDYQKRKNSHISHLNRGAHFNRYLQAAWAKYGQAAFSFEVLEECNRKMLDGLERSYINKYKSADEKRGYNLMTGGQAYREFTDEVRQRMSEANKGRVFTEEHKRKISKSQIGKTISREAREKTSRTKIKNRSGCGEKNYNAVMSDAVAGKVLIDLLNGETVRNIMDEYNIPQNSVYNLMYGRTYTHIMPEARDVIANRVVDALKEKEDRAFEMYCGGRSQNSIAQDLSMSRNTIRRVVKERVTEMW